MLIGYARVSTVGQETQLQLDALASAGVQKTYTEKVSGVGHRPQLLAMLAALRPGDTVVVYKVDRLARSLKDLLTMLERLRAQGCALKSLTEPVDTSSAMGEFVLQILGAVAQFERSLIRERCNAGRIAYRERGGKFGPPEVIQDDAVHLAARLYRDGFSISEGATAFGVSYTAFRGALLRAGVARRSRREAVRMSASTYCRAGIGDPLAGEGSSI